MDPPTSSPSRGGLAYLPGLLLIAAAYYLSGRLAALLAMPPGYATAIWPPAGIALAALLLSGNRFWPAVCVGSLLINLGLGFDASGWTAALKSTAVAFNIALGASAQAWVGAWLIRRFAHFPNGLDDEREVGKFLLLGGPVACLINASWGVTMLVAGGKVAADAYVYNWWIWWVGDTIGVLVFTPLLLIWSQHSRPAWHHRRLVVTLPLIACFAGSVWAFLQVNRWEVERQRQWFLERTDDFVDMVHSRIERYMVQLEATRDGLQSGVEPERFRHLSRQLLERERNMLGLSWTPVVSLAERAAFERERGPDYSLKERKADGSLTVAATREVYVPIELVENRSPAASNWARLYGFDIASEPIRHEALWRARDGGQPAITAWTPLLSRPGDLGVVIYVPLYREVAPAPAERRRSLRGYLAGSFRMSDLVAAAVADQKLDQIEFRLLDLADPDGQVLYFSTFEGRQYWQMQTDSRVRELFSATLKLEVGGRNWEIKAVPTSAYLAANRSWQAWAVLASGLLFTGLIGAFLLVVTGRAGRVELLVEQRTEELTQKNLELENANAAKDRFLATMSHELRTPLNAILGFTGTLLMRLPGPLNGGQQKQLQTIQNSARYLLSLINDLLDLAKVESGKVELALEAVPCRAVIDEVLLTLRPLAEEKKLALRLGTGPDATARTDRRAFSQIVINLVSNAIKYTERGEVEITVEVESASVSVSVRDTGCGIRAEDQARLFQAFSQLDDSSTRRHEGTGLGLYLSQKFARLLGGRITFRSEYGQGSVFTVTIPLA